MDKAALRKYYLTKRRGISSKEKLKLDDLILIQFQRLAFDDVHTLLSFWPLQSNNEPFTHLFSSYLRHHIPGLQTAYPKSNFSTLEMQALLINEDTVYEESAYKIMEPKNGRFISPEEVDLIFVPLVICDSKGFRVGYGKGFYDKYIAQCRKDALKVGFSYFPPVDKIEGLHQFDIPLDYCITPEEVYEF